MNKNFNLEWIQNEINYYSEMCVSVSYFDYIDVLKQLRTVTARIAELEGALKKIAEKLPDTKRMHHYCEDCWYSCPKAEDGCCNEAEGDECNCGADKTNLIIDEMMGIAQEVLK